ncbi:MAG: hypothetical protein DWQ37_10785, partial [Planctomycetota bacterium]
MNRKSLVARLLDSTGSNHIADRQRYSNMQLEPLEDRKMLAATVYVNDNWVNVSDPGNPVEVGDFVTNGNDTINPGGIFAEYGVDAFGTVDGSSVVGNEFIRDAIPNVDADGTLEILEGTYTESDIIIDSPMIVTGAVGATTLIVPETESSGDDNNFGVGTHSGIIIYSPSVTVSNLTLDGNGNGSLTGSLNYHHGVTTLYDSQNGGDYASLHNGNLPLVQLGAISGNRSVPDLRIDNVTVNNVYWHGLTLSALAGKSFGIIEDGNPGTTDLEILNSTVNNVGATKNENAIGILMQNLNNTSEASGQPDSQAINNTISNVGIGLSARTFGTSSYGNDSAARSRPGFVFTTVNNAAVRAYEIIEGQVLDIFANVANWTGANTATGVYINFGDADPAGFEIDGAQIGMHIQNATLNQGGGPTILFGTKLTGPGTGVAGSVGILVENSVEFTNSVSANIVAGSIVTGYETGIKVNQAVAPGDAAVNQVLLDGVNVLGNGTAISVGNGSVLRGNPAALTDVVVTGTGRLEARYTNWENFYQNNPGNAATPIFTPPKATDIQTGNVSLGASATFAPLLTNETGSTVLFDFESAANYPFATPPDAPVNGVVPSPYGALFNWFGNVTQDGSGQLVVGGGATNGYGYDFLFGGNNVPIGGNQFQLIPTDIHDHTNLDIVIKLGAGNVSETLWFGLFDIRGNANVYSVDLTKLNSTAYTTVSIDLLSPSIDLTGPDGQMDLSTISGYVFGGDQGNANGLFNVPMAFNVEEIGTSSIPAGQLDVTGTVNLGGATLDGSLSAGFAATVGEEFTIVNNDGADAVVGTFAGLSEGASLSIGGANFTISYMGGDGNDVVLTRQSDAVTEVLGRQIFYNGSKFDGFSTAINASDDLAIATDKSAYLPGSG